MTPRRLPPGVDTAALVLNLTAQEQGYARLEDLGRRTLDGLVGGHSEDLGLLIAEQDGLISAQAVLEAERLALLRPLAAAWGQPAEEITAREIEEAAPRPMTEQLGGLRTALLERATTVRELNARNRRLLRSASGVVARWRAYLTRSLNPNAVYSEHGSVELPATPWGLDQEA